MGKYSERKAAHSRFSFGATASIITSLGMVIGLSKLSNARTSIVSGLLVIALADNISDSLGIHIYQESEGVGKKDVWLSTFTNFATRLLVTSVFIALVLFFPLRSAVILSTIWGLITLTIISYIIARTRKENLYLSILEHIGISVMVIILSNFLSEWIHSKLDM